MRIRGLGNPTAAPDLIEALRRERAEVLRFCADLSSDDWVENSAAEGLARPGRPCAHRFCMPRNVRARAVGRDAEQRHRGDQRRVRRTPAQLACRPDSQRVATVERTGDPRSEVRLLDPAAARTRSTGCVGRYPMQLLLGGAMVFDWHTHLRYDMARGLQRPPPATDDNRMAVVLAWMLAVLENQLNSSPLDWLDRPLGIVLDGPGGGAWILDPSHDELRDGASFTDVETWITAQALDFPEWGTGRARWVDRDVTILGDQGYGAAFLDMVNVVQRRMPRQRKACFSMSRPMISFMISVVPP